MNESNRIDQGINVTRDEANRLQERVSEFVRGAIDSGREQVNALGDRATDVVRSAETRIKDRPLLWILVLFLVGLVIGRVAARK